MITLTAIHYIYIIMTILILVALLFKKEIVIPCIVGILLIGLTYSGSIIKSVQILNNALIASCVELLGIIIVIALVVAMSKAMNAVSADELMIRPIRSIIKTPNGAFWGIGFAMLIVSWLIWPSPAVALIGALLLPVAGRVGLPAIYAAVAMNLMGHGAGLSSDFFIQGAPAISSKAAGVDVSNVIASSVPLWAIMSISTLTISFLLMKRDMKKNKEVYANQTSTVITQKNKEIKKPKIAILMALLIPVGFLVDILLMIVYGINGGDSTALVSGTALILTCIISIADVGVKMALEDVVTYVKEGFIFSIKIFAPVIIIAAFFFMGSEGFAQTVLGENATGILNDIGMFIANRVPMSKVTLTSIEVGVGVITGLDGSGFSGLPLVGSIAQTFSVAANGNTSVLTALGQIATIWVGGGTIIPWGVIPVAAICGVEPSDLARKNLIPVFAGLLITSIAAIFIM